MPRTGHGGRRQGEQGASYSNRTDLNAHVPVNTAPNQAYGNAAEQRAAQNAIPMAPTQVTPQAAQPIQSVLPLQNAQRQPSPGPGELPFLEATARPNEPVTEGLPFGPGAGPEVLNRNTQPARPITSAIDELTSSPNASPQVSSLAESARALGL